MNTKEAKKVGNAVGDVLGAITYGDIREDQLQQYVEKAWPKLLGAVGVIALGIWLWRAVEENRNKVRGEASARMTAVQDSYRIVTAPAVEGESEEAKAAALKAKDTAARALTDSLRSLTDSYAGTLYGELAPAYQLIRDTAQAGVIQGPQSVSSFAPAKKLSAAELAVELKNLIALRKLVDAKATNVWSEGDRVLRGAVVTGGEVLLVLGRLAATAEERSKVQEQIDQFFKARPELRKTVADDLRSLGYGIQD